MSNQSERVAFFIGDGVVATGFSKMNHAYIDGLRRRGWQIHMMALNHNGDTPKKYDFQIYTTYAPGGVGGGFGLNRVSNLIGKIGPEVVLVTNDPWNIPQYLDRIGNVPTIASLAVDGKNCRGSGLNGLRHAIFWTNFGLTEARLGGYSGQASVIPLGVDLDVFKPVDTAVARKEMAKMFSSGRFPVDGFIVGAVGRNQQRKRLDLTLMYFAKWIKSRDIRDAYLLCHVAPTGDDGFDLNQLAGHLGIADRIIVIEPNIGFGVKEEMLSLIYSVMSAQVSTSQNEGWALCTMEGMACGVPQIVPDWAALSEWPGDAAIKVPCGATACTNRNINAIGGVPNEEETIAAFDLLYTSQTARAELASSGLELVRRPEFRWSNIGDRYAETVERALNPAVPRPDAGRMGERAAV